MQSQGSGDRTLWNGLSVLVALDSAEGTLGGRSWDLYHPHIAESSFSMQQLVTAQTLVTLKAALGQNILNLKSVVRVNVLPLFYS